MGNSCRKIKNWGFNTQNNNYCRAIVNQCNATTKRGIQCLFKKINGSQYCRIHIKYRQKHGLSHLLFCYSMNHLSKDSLLLIMSYLD